MPRSNIRHLYARRTIGALKRMLPAIGLACTGLTVLATENGGSGYPIGIDTNYSGVMPADGANLSLNYSHYTAKHTRNGSGADNPTALRFGSQVDTVGARFSYVWPQASLLGARVETRVIQAIPSVQLDFALRRPAPLPPLDRSGSMTGLGDINIAPVVLGWQSSGLHQLAGVDFFLKTGNYDAQRNVNTGRNYRQVAPFYAITWFPTPSLSLSAKLRWGFNGTNNATGYTSGNEATLEFNAGYRVAPKWIFGASGYVYRQTSDDVQKGVVVNGDGNRGKVNALGPSISYSFSQDAVVALKIQHEFNARNRPEGARLWVMSKIPF